MRATLQDWKKGQRKLSTPPVLELLRAGFVPTHVVLHQALAYKPAHIFVRFTEGLIPVDEIKLLFKLKWDAVVRIAGEQSYPGDYFDHERVVYTRAMKKRFNIA